MNRSLQRIYPHSFIKKHHRVLVAITRQEDAMNRSLQRIIRILSSNSIIASRGGAGQIVGNDSARERVPIPAPRRDKSVPTDVPSRPRRYRSFLHSYIKNVIYYH